ncbi:MAG: DUF2264 domain-containing protein [Oculatellaceae cyanobacterium bins.114]|nr:DUF2264 domain-containing protein [Oculatellaceae cyanobacterium bins.114]
MTGWTRHHWEELFLVLLKGILTHASESKAHVWIPTIHRERRDSDGLEGFARSFIMVGPWLHANQPSQVDLDGTRVDLAEFYQEGLLAGTDPHHPDYWGAIGNQSQNLVECASLAWSLYLSKAQIWDRYSSQEKQQIANYLLQCNQVQSNETNWLLFDVITNTVLKRLGMSYSPEQIHTKLQACNEMYVGDGWYRDGTKENHFDYYNAWGFHYYHLMWVILDGDSQPDLAQLHLDRMRQFMHNFRYFFAGDGTTPCFGRSMTYRFAYLAPIALGVYLNCIDLSMGEIKTMYNMGTKVFFENGILTEDLHLSLGYLRPCASMLESYSCGGSPYWAGKAFNLFLLPNSHPFWQVPEEPLAIHSENFSVPIKSPGFLLLGNKETGHVQLINQKSSQKNYKSRKKYNNFAYSSVFTYEPRSVEHNYNCDNALTFSQDGVQYEQRWGMKPLFCEKNFTASRYWLPGNKRIGLSYSYVLVKDDFMINVHRIETRKPLFFREGGYPLGFNKDETEAVRVISIPGAEAVYHNSKISFLRNLYGYTHQSKAYTIWGNELQDGNPRYAHSMIPALCYKSTGERTIYLASMVYGKIGETSIEQLMQLVTDFRIEQSLVQVSFYDGEKAVMQLGKINPVDVLLNGDRITGKVAMARVSADGGDRMVVYGTKTTEIPRIQLPSVESTKQLVKQLLIRT